MKLLLDTHSFLWYCEGSQSLSLAARGAIADLSNERYVSVATPWEVAIKLSQGKLRIQAGYRTLFGEVLSANEFAILPVEIRHLHSLLGMPRHHGDPFDRLMIAQALTDGFTVVTCDEAFHAYDIPILW